MMYFTSGKLLLCALALFVAFTVSSEVLGQTTASGNRGNLVNDLKSLILPQKSDTRGGGAQEKQNTDLTPRATDV